MRPSVGQTTESIYAALEPLAAGDEERDWPLLRFIDAICQAGYERPHELAADRGEQPGWQAILDPTTSPAYALPWLAQFVGARLTPDLSEAEQREVIEHPEGFARGTPAAMRQAIQRQLTDTKSVDIQERYGGDAYVLWIRTLASETPSVARVLQAIRSQKPMGIVLDFDVQAGQDWAAFGSSVTDWSDAGGDYPDWDQVRSRHP